MSRSENAAAHEETPVMEGVARFLRDLSASGRAYFTADELDAATAAQRDLLDATHDVDPLDAEHEDTLLLNVRPIPDVLPLRENIVALRIQWLREGYAMALMATGPTPLNDAMRARFAASYAETAARRIQA